MISGKRLVINKGVMVKISNINISLKGYVNMKNEIWKTIKSPFSNYSVSTIGRIKNNKTGYIFNNKNIYLGYIRVALTNDCGKSVKRFVHALVAQTFLDIPEGKNVVHHIDENKLNNNIENLKMISQQENIMASTRQFGAKTRPILQYDLQMNLVQRWNRIKDVPYTKNKSNIISACKGKLKTAYGFIWRYEDLDLPNEIWKSIEFNGYDLEVSSLGRVKLLSGLKTHGNKTNSGYRIVGIKGKCIAVHKLVCMAFKPISTPNLTINHKDFNKENNAVFNLEWITQSENNKHAYLNKNRKEAEVRKTMIKKIMDDNSFEIYESIHEAARKNNISVGNICMVCKGQRPKAGGYKWEYVI